MRLFDFVKDVGRQIFDTDAEAANNIQGVEKGVADDLKARKPAPEAPREKAWIYEIVSGDTLGA